MAGTVEDAPLSNLVLAWTVLFRSVWHLKARLYRGTGCSMKLPCASLAGSSLVKMGLRTATMDRACWMTMGHTCSNQRAQLAVMSLGGAMLKQDGDVGY